MRADHAHPALASPAPRGPTYVRSAPRTGPRAEDPDDTDMGLHPDREPATEGLIMDDRFSDYGQARQPGLMSVYAQECALAESILDTMPDDIETRKTIMTALSPQKIMTELAQRGIVLARANSEAASAYLHHLEQSTRSAV